MRPDLPSDVAAIGLTPRVIDRQASARKLWRLLRANRVGILHSHTFHCSRFAAPLGWMARVPVRVETIHVPQDRSRFRLKASYFRDRIASGFITDFVTVSAANAWYLEGERYIPVGIIHLIRDGVAVDRFEAGRTGTPELRNRLVIDPDAPVVLAVDCLEAREENRVLLDAWKAVCTSFPAARLVCIGDGKPSNELEMKAAETGIADSVRFVSYQRDVSNWLAVADFTILPSLNEGLPLVAIESLAAGRPVITSLVGAITEVVL